MPAIAGYGRKLEVTIAARQTAQFPAHFVRVCRAPHSSVIRCYITHRAALSCADRPPLECLLDTIARNLQAGVEWIQIREKDLSARALSDLTHRVLALPNPHGSKILVNTRVDVAIAAGAAGAHLPAGSPEPRRFRSLAPEGFLIGVSCHDKEEVMAAETGGADYAVFGPVFAPLSKSSELPPRGLGTLAEVCRSVSIPVLALGGISSDTVKPCEDAGAAGIAGISLFQG